MVRHSHEDAPSESEFDRLLTATSQLDYPFNIECRWVLIAAGRLGMRAGEISHMHSRWIDWDREVIEIPRYRVCTDGKSGGVCGYCNQQARQEAQKNDDLTLEDALDHRWHPKTDAAARAIPFAFNDQIRNIVEAFWADREVFPKSRVAVNRRVDRAAEAADIPPSAVYPHSLRACAGTWHAYRGVPAVALQSLMGWNQLSTAQKYIRLSGGATAKALEEAHHS